MPRDISFDRFRRGRKGPRDKERDKGAAMPPLPLGSAGTQAARTGGSALMETLRTGWQSFWLAPQISWSGAALGSILALMGSVYGAHYLWTRHAASSGSADQIPFPFRLSYPEGDVERPPVESLLRGFKALFADAERDSLAGAEAGEGDGDTEELPLPGASAGGMIPDAGPDAKDAGTDSGAAEEGPAPALAKLPAPGLASGPGGAGAPAGGGEAVLGGSAGGDPAAVPAGKGSLTDRAKRAAAPGRSLRGARGKPGSMNALRQLKMSEKLSRQASYAPKTGQSYETAGAAFGGGTSGTPIDGVGAGDSGGGIGTSGSSAGSEESAATKICPSGYILTGDSCVPFGEENKTPYQSLVDMARMFVAGAALCALLGLFLLTRTGNPTLQILGGILLGIAAALVLAAVAIGNRVQDRYEQAAQNQAIQGSGSDAMQGQSP